MCKKRVSKDNFCTPSKDGKKNPIGIDFEQETIKVNLYPDRIILTQEKLELLKQKISSSLNIDENIKTKFLSFIDDEINTAKEWEFDFTVEEFRRDFEKFTQSLKEEKVYTIDLQYLLCITITNQFLDFNNAEQMRGR